MEIESNDKTRENDDFIMLPKVDFCFKELMKSKKVRAGLIAAVLEIRPDMIESTELMPTFLETEYPDDKYGILDVRVKLWNGMQLNFEMQLSSFEYWTNRILFYWAKMFTEQIKKGQEYDVLRPCIHVSILDFVHFRDDYDFIHKIGLLDEKTSKKYSELMQFYIFELPKLPQENQNETEIIQWMRFFNGEKKEDFEKVAEHNEYVGEAYDCLKQLSADEVTRLRYEWRQKCLLDKNTMLSSARREGEESGRCKALVEQVIKKMHKGLTSEETAEMLEEDVSIIKHIYAVSQKYAPEYNLEKICSDLLENKPEQPISTH